MRLLTAKWEMRHQLPGKGIPMMVVKTTRQRTSRTEAILGVATAANADLQAARDDAANPEPTALTAATPQKGMQDITKQWLVLVNNV